jgi:hypothetical protein
LKSRWRIGKNVLQAALPSIEYVRASNHLSPSCIDLAIAYLQIVDSTQTLHRESFILINLRTSLIDSLRFGLSVIEHLSN